MLGLPETLTALPPAIRRYRNQPCSSAKSFRRLAVDAAKGGLMFDEKLYSLTVINAEESIGRAETTSGLLYA
jgi:hypothetical protein